MVSNRKIKSLLFLSETLEQQHKRDWNTEHKLNQLKKRDRNTHTTAHTHNLLVVGLRSSLKLCGEKETGCFWNPLLVFFLFLLLFYLSLLSLSNQLMVLPCRQKKTVFISIGNARNCTSAWLVSCLSLLPYAGGNEAQWGSPAPSNWNHLIFLKTHFVLSY